MTSALHAVVRWRFYPVPRSRVSFSRSDAETAADCSGRCMQQPLTVIPSSLSSSSFPLCAGSGRSPCLLRLLAPASSSSLLLLPALRTRLRARALAAPPQPGRTAIELLNYEFREARWDWRDQHRSSRESALHPARGFVAGAGGNKPQLPLLAVQEPLARRVQLLPDGLGLGLG